MTFSANVFKEICWRDSFWFSWFDSWLDSGRACCCSILSLTVKRKRTFIKFWIEEERIDDSNYSYGFCLLISLPRNCLIYLLISTRQFNDEFKSWVSCENSIISLQIYFSTSYHSLLNSNCLQFVNIVEDGLSSVTFPYLTFSLFPWNNTIFSINLYFF